MGEGKGERVGGGAFPLQMRLRKFKAVFIVGDGGGIDVVH